MRDRVGEGLQLQVGRPELSGAAHDALLQFGVETSVFVLGALAFGDVVDHGVEQRPAVDTSMGTL